MAGRVLLANVPASAHRALAGRIGAPPVAAVLSGLRPSEEGEVLAAYAASGLVRAGRDVRGGFVRLTLVAM